MEAEGHATPCVFEVGSRTSVASYAQQRLWFFDRLQPRSSLYIIQHALTLPGAPDLPSVEATLAELIRRHEVLRTTFVSADGTPMQVIHPRSPLAITTLDLSNRPDEVRERELKRQVEQDGHIGFDLERGPLLRATLVRLGSRRSILLVAVHHIVFDDWSTDIFEREFHAIYEGVKAGRPSSLPPLTLRYADYASAQRARYDAGSFDPQLAYWRERLRGLPATTEMPIDQPRPPAQTFSGASRAFTLPAAVARGLRDLTRGAGATLFMSLFAAFAVLVHRHSGQTDLAIGTPVADRNRPSLTNVIGFLVNTLVLRLDVGDDPTFRTRRVRRVAPRA